MPSSANVWDMSDHPCRRAKTLAAWLVRHRGLSIMVARLKKIDSVATHQAHQPVLLRDPARPSSFQKMLERLGLANPGEWLTQHGLDQIQHPQGNLAIGLNPVAEVLAEFRVENSLSRSPRSLGYFTALGQD